MKSLTVGPNDAGQRLDKFIVKTFPALPQSMLYKAIRTKHIKRNGKRCEISVRLEEGDRIDLYLKDDLLAEAPKAYPFLKASSKIEVLYEDSRLLLVDKPAGLIVHSDESHYGDTLIDRIQRYLFEKGEYRPAEENAFAPALVNRIDRNTGGIVIAAKTAESLRLLNEMMKERAIDKFYLCILHGRLAQKEGILEGYLEKDSAQNRVFVHSRPIPGGKTIRTKYRIVAERERYSLAEVELLTGRTHQIRAHFASIGHPLAGDGKYGTNALNRACGYKAQALYSYKLTFHVPDPESPLHDLDMKTVEAPKVWFVQDFYGGVFGPSAAPAAKIRKK